MIKDKNNKIDKINPLKLHYIILKIMIFRNNIFITTYLYFFCSTGDRIVYLVGLVIIVEKIIRTAELKYLRPNEDIIFILYFMVAGRKKSLWIFYLFYCFELGFILNYVWLWIKRWYPYIKTTMSRTVSISCSTTALSTF